MTAYNLTATQKQLLRDIVGLVQAGTIDEEFDIYWHGNEAVGFRAMLACVNKPAVELPTVTKSGIAALGLTVILPEQAQTFVESLPIEKFHGIGKVSATKMHELNIHTGADLKERSEAELVQHFGKVGHHYFKIARAQDDREVEANRVRKSVGAETSYAQDLSDHAVMLHELETIAQTVYQRLERHRTGGRTITLKVKFANYQQITRSRTGLSEIRELEEIVALAQALFEAVDLERRHVRLLGISLSSLGCEERSFRASDLESSIQLVLF